MLADRSWTGSKFMLICTPELFPGFSPWAQWFIRACVCGAEQQGYPSAAERFQLTPTTTDHSYWEQEVCLLQRNIHYLFLARLCMHKKGGFLSAVAQKLLITTTTHIHVAYLLAGLKYCIETWGKDLNPSLILG